MNKKFTGLLVALAVVGNAFASTANNRTHLNTRLCRENIPAYTTFGEMVADRDDDRWGSNVEATGFFARSTNGSHLAKNFGADGGTTITVIATQSASQELLALNTNRPNVPGELLSHMTGAIANK